MRAKHVGGARRPLQEGSLRARGGKAALLSQARR